VSDGKQKESIAAGWYQSPGEPATDRYWDGSTWTSRTRPRPLAGLQPAPPNLVEQDSGRHPGPWIATGIGLALLVAAFLAFTTRQSMAGTLTAVTGCIVLGVSTALLRLDLRPRHSAVLSTVISAIVLIAGLIVALTVASAAWASVASAVVLLAVNAVKLVRASRNRPHGERSGESAPPRR